MKILHLTTHLNVGGITSYILSVGRVLAGRGHRLYAASAGGVMEDGLRAAGFMVLRAPVRTKNEFHPKILLAAARLSRWVRRERIDVIHAHTRVTQAAAALMGSVCRVPVVTTAHGFFKDRLSRRLVDLWGRRVIAISPGVAEALRRQGVGDDRLRLVWNGIDLDSLRRRVGAVDREAVRIRYGIPRGAAVAGAVGRLVKDKGHEVLIRSLALLRRDFPGLHLLILGEGRERGALEALIRQTGLDERVHLVSGPEDTAAAYAVMDLLVHPATYREGFGFVVAEAMALGIPVIASRVPALDTLLSEGRTGWFARPGDAGSLADVIRAVRSKPEEAAVVARNARVFAEETFTLERMSGQILSVYEEAVAKGGPA